MLGRRLQAVVTARVQAVVDVQLIGHSERRCVGSCRDSSPAATTVVRASRVSSVPPWTPWQRAGRIHWEGSERGNGGAIRKPAVAAGPAGQPLAGLREY
jgi:hypothetical protein